MKNINTYKKLTAEEFEYVLEGCEEPWSCPPACFQSCSGCLQLRYKANKSNYKNKRR